MLEVDGSKKSGSGTILRLSVALAAILNEPLHIFNIRHRRPQPGLKPQHLEAVVTAAKLCKAETKGASLGSTELWFYPDEIVGGKVEAAIGTAGSIPMLLITVLPICAFAKRSVAIHVSKGGTDVSHSPTINYLKHVFLPVLGKMGLRTSLTIQKYGYYPKDMGEVSIDVEPQAQLSPLNFAEFGEVASFDGVSVCTFLADRKVAERQAEAADAQLRRHGYESEIQIINDFSNPVQKGSSLTLWTETTTDVILGGDAIGELRKPSEVVGKEAAKRLLQETRAKATVDVHLADMLVPYVALAEGESTYFSRSITNHLETNIWLAQEILDAKFDIDKVGNLYKVETSPL